MVIELVASIRTSTWRVLPSFKTNIDRSTPGHAPTGTWHDTPLSPNMISGQAVGPVTLPTTTHQVFLRLGPGSRNTTAPKLKHRVLFRLGSGERRTSKSGFLRAQGRMSFPARMWSVWSLAPFHKQKQRRLLFSTRTRQVMSHLGPVD